MRKSAKALGLVFVALLGSLGLTLGAAFSAAIAFGATALIVPGTGTHDVLTNTPYRDHAADRFINPAGVACTSTDGCDIEGVDYPAEFFPFVIFDGWCPGLSCDTWNTSVDTGVTNLDAALEPFKDPANTEDVIVFGYSQGGAVVTREMYDLAALDQSIKDRISVVTIGNINNPRGLFSRLGFLPTIPFLDITFGPQLPTDIGIKSTNYSFEYDPVGDAPSYWGNPLAMMNAVAAFEYVHGYYLVPDDNSLPTDTMPYGYDDVSLAAAINDPANRRTYGDATFVLIPQKGPLPIFQPLLGIAPLGPVVKPLVALLNPVTKLLVNLGYDRVTNPGIPQTLSILPFNPLTLNPITFSVQFAQAIVQGVQDAVGTLSPSLQAPEPAPLQAVESFSRLASAEVTDTPATVGAGDESTAVTTLAADENAADMVDAKSPADEAAAAKEAKAAERAAAKEAKAAAAKAKAEKKAAAKAAKEAAKAAKEAAKKARQEAADSAEEASGNDKPAATAGTTPAAADGATADQAA